MSQDQNVSYAICVENAFAGFGSCQLVLAVQKESLVSVVFAHQ